MYGKPLGVQKEKKPFCTIPPKSKPALRKSQLNAIARRDWSDK